MVDCRFIWQDTVSTIHSWPIHCWRHQRAMIWGVRHATAAFSRDRGLSVILERDPKLVPRGVFTIGCSHIVDLVKCCIGELQNVYHAQNFTSLTHDWQIEVVAIYTIS